MSTISQALDTLFKSVHVQDLDAVINFLDVVINFTKVNEYDRKTPGFWEFQKFKKITDYDVFLAVKAGRHLDQSGDFFVNEHLGQFFIETHLSRTLELLGQVSRSLRLGKFEVIGNKLHIPADYPLWDVKLHLRVLLEQRRSITTTPALLYSARKGIYEQNGILAYKISGERKHIFEKILFNTKNNQPTQKDDLFELGSNFDFGDAIKGINKECRRIFSLKPKVIKFSRSAGGYFINIDEVSVEVGG